MMSKYLPTYKILATDIAYCTYQKVVNVVNKAIHDRRPLYISAIASQTLVRAYYDQNLAKALSLFDILTPDSYWIKQSLIFLYGKKLSQRVYGPTLMLHLCTYAEKKRIPIFLYGTNKQTLLMLKNSLLEKYPHLHIVEMEQSIYRSLTKNEEIQLIKKINLSGAKIVFVGIGSPQQEKLVAELIKINQLKTITVTVGAAFDFISGKKKQAPTWIGENGFEWLFRLIHNPRELGKRYLFYGPQYLYLIFIQKVKQIIFA